MQFNTQYPGMQEPSYATPYQMFLDQNGEWQAYFGNPLKDIDPPVNSQQEAYTLWMVKKLLVGGTQPAQLRGSLTADQDAMLTRMEAQKGLTDQTAYNPGDGNLVNIAQYQGRGYAAANLVSTGTAGQAQLSAPTVTAQTQAQMQTQTDSTTVTGSASGTTQQQLAQQNTPPTLNCPWWKHSNYSCPEGAYCTAMNAASIKCVPNVPLLLGIAAAGAVALVLFRRHA